MPAGWEEFAVQELVLAEGRGTAEGLLTCALALEARLPGTKAAAIQRSPLSSSRARGGGDILAGAAVLASE